MVFMRAFRLGLRAAKALAQPDGLPAGAVAFAQKRPVARRGQAGKIGGIALLHKAFGQISGLCVALLKFGVGRIGSCLCEALFGSTCHWAACLERFARIGYGAQVHETALESGILRPGVGFLMDLLRGRDANIRP